MGIYLVKLGFFSRFLYPAIFSAIITTWFLDWLRCQICHLSFALQSQICWQSNMDFCLHHKFSPFFMQLEKFFNSFFVYWQLQCLSCSTWLNYKKKTAKNILISFFLLFITFAFFLQLDLLQNVPNNFQILGNIKLRDNIFIAIQSLGFG